MRLVAFTAAVDDLDATWLWVLRARLDPSAILVCHRLPAKVAAVQSPPDANIERQYVGGLPHEALHRALADWRPSVALVLEPPTHPIDVESLVDCPIVVVNPPTGEAARTVAAVLRSDSGWITARASARDGDERPTITVRAPVYATDGSRDLRARLEELRRLAAVKALASATDRASPPPEAEGPRSEPLLRPPAPPRRRRVVERLAKGALTVVAIGLFRPIRDLVRTVRGRHPVRIFTFHRVTDLCRDTISVPPAAFRSRVAYIARHHDVVSLETALDAIERKRRLRRPLAVITFDDAYRSVYDLALPILAEEGLTATCFASTGLVGTDDRFPHDAGSPVRPLLEVMGWKELASLRSLGWEIGAHTHTHRRLTGCSGDEHQREIVAPLAELRQRLWLEQVAIAYPYGGQTDIDAPALDAIVRAGYRACLGNFGGENFPGDRLFSVKRFDISGTYEPLSWRARAHGIDLGALRSTLLRSWSLAGVLRTS